MQQVQLAMATESNAKTEACNDHDIGHTVLLTVNLHLHALWAYTCESIPVKELSLIDSSLHADIPNKCLISHV